MIKEYMNKIKKCYGKMFKKSLTPIKPKKETKTKVTSTSGPMTNAITKEKPKKS